VVEAGDLELAIEPLFDDQEHDTRISSGTIYWEGAVRALRGGKPIGRGYLELTGYWRRVAF
jgi:predicted secreted hydrolase